MNKQISEVVRIAFLVHVAIALIFGLPLFIIPGRFLLLVRWQPIDPVITRLFGAVLLAMALGDWLCHEATEWAVVNVLLQVHICAAVLGALGVLRHLLFARTPAFAWVFLAFMVVYAAVWIYSFITGRPQAA